MFNRALAPAAVRWQALKPLMCVREHAGGHPTSDLVFRHVESERDDVLRFEAQWNRRTLPASARVENGHDQSDRRDGDLEPDECADQRAPGRLVTGPGRRFIASPAVTEDSRARNQAEQYAGQQCQSTGDRQCDTIDRQVREVGVRGPSTARISAMMGTQPPGCTPPTIDSATLSQTIGA